MANGLLAAIFDAKEGIYSKVPYNDQQFKVFDLEREHYFYGRVDHDGDGIILDTHNFLQGVNATKNATHLLVDFVADAFHSFQAHWKKAIKYKFDRESVYYRHLKVYKSYTNGDLTSEYTNYINILYQDFVNNYLSVDRRDERIKNYRDFIKEFMRYSLRICDKYPITKTGFITSTHCSPFISGLMLEIAPERHGTEYIGRLENYLDAGPPGYPGSYYRMWVKAAAKFGFMVDRNAPWRLVFNIGSGHPPKDPSNPAGAQLFMSAKGV